MRVHIGQLHEPQDISLEIESQECDFPQDIGRFRSPIRMEAHLRKVQEEVTIEGRILTQIELVCSRCLKTFDYSCDDTFEVIYLPQPDEQELVDEIELEAADLSISYYQGETISLTELIREQLLLWLPVKPLCKDECAGLCPSCGQDLNEGSCHCPKETLDPRFAILGQLLGKDSFARLHQKRSEQ